MNQDTLESLLNRVTVRGGDEGVLLALQEVLVHPESVRIIHSAPVLLKSIRLISKRLYRSLLPASLYHQIQSVSGKFRKARSLHTYAGNFIWADISAQNVFSQNNDELRLLTLFRLMHPRSRRSLYAQYGEELLLTSSSRVITYLLEDGATALSSRCTLVVYPSGGNGYSGRVLVETRLARHTLKREPVEEDYSRTPRYLLAKANSVAMGLPTEEGFESEFSFKNVPIESINISPFLKNES